MSSTDFLKQNESLTPQGCAGYLSGWPRKKPTRMRSKRIEAIKSGLIQSFFQVQANVDMLTSGQKAILDDYP